METTYEDIRKRYFTKSGEAASPAPRRCEVIPVQREDPTKGDIGKESNKTFRELEKYPEVQTWLKTVSEGTGKQYLRILEKFCAWSGKTPDQLIQERDKETRNANPNDRTGIRDLILDFRKHLEEEKYAPKTINAWDGAIRGFFTAVIGREGMVNVKNYRDGCVSKRKDLVPTLEELKRMLDVVNIEEKIRLLFIAQTGMRVSDAVALKIEDIQRELELGKVPLAITYLPKKDRESIGERITFLASDGVELLKQYLEWRRRNGENITPESHLFVGRKDRGIKAVTADRFNRTIKEAAKKAGLNGNGKYGTIRTHCLRKFFITQLTNHGIEDKIINFFICHKLPEIDRVYWFRRVEELREIYSQRQQYLNPFNNKQKYNLEEIKDIKAKIEDLEAKNNELFEGDKLKELIRECIQDEMENKVERYESRIVSSEQEIIELSNLGYECQPIGASRWLMKRKVINTISLTTVKYIKLTIYKFEGMKKASWIEEYIPELLAKKLTIEDVRRLREKETGKRLQTKTVTRLLNELGYSVNDFKRNGDEPNQNEQSKVKGQPCSDCSYMRLGSCITSKQTYQGWLDKFDKGYCPLKTKKIAGEVLSS